MKFWVTILIAIVLLNCSACKHLNHSSYNNSSSDITYIDTTISLGNGITLCASEGEFYQNKDNPGNSFTTYTSIKIIKDKKTIFSDTNFEYEFDHNLHPFCRKLEGNKYEFLIGVNDRPNSNFLLHLIINNTGVIKRDSFPEWIVEPKIIGSDGMLEFAGLKNDWEAWGDENEPLMGYVPILFFKFKKDGIVLDSAMTIKVNTGIYGKFEGYQYQNTPYKYKIYNPKLNKEIESLMKG